ncbi:hypothetical protein [Thalassotalea sp. Y01]|uniref:hypothetical protein n=1 Tax=Thalassotalea sp. Y01 TaxID=2729613 RepID=UPI00145F7889|nr:hypothetical protein [Thalassotalea sp. Y01]NMP17872.1 hypothetical protein [Thalassotalea sp. Y01]
MAQTDVNNTSPLKQLYELWQRASIVLASVFMTSIIATLICAALGEANPLVIVSALLLGLAHGLRALRNIEAGIGLQKHLQKRKKFDI